MGIELKVVTGLKDMLFKVFENFHIVHFEIPIIPGSRMRSNSQVMSYFKILLDVR
jgi:hypothetical protein